ncbi:MAG: phage protease [Nitrospirota bacterium]|nr:phage protease [Nitrospirota bacterium]
MKRKSHIGIAVCHLDLANTGEIQLLPAGKFRAMDNRPGGIDAWRVDADIAARVIAREAGRVSDFVIDYNHQTIYSRENGQPAPAAGWFRRMEWREGRGLFAVDVRWTDKAATAITSGEFRYISPVFWFSTDTGEVTQIFNAALTNNPALDGMQEVATLVAAHFDLSPEPEDEDAMNEKLLKLLDLKKGADDEAAIAACAALIQRAEAAEAKAAEANTQVAVLTAQLPDAKPDPAKYVPLDVVKPLQEQVAALTAQVNGARVTGLIATAMASGKLLPAMEPWARELGGKDVTALENYLASAVPVAALTGTQTGGKAPGEEGVAALSAEEHQVCATLGMTPETFLAAKAKK